MNITVLGTGIVGRAIAGKLISLGHQTFVGTRNPTSTMEKQEPDSYGNQPFNIWQKDHPEVVLMSFEEAASNTDGIIFNCTNGQASIAALKTIGANILSGKVLVDLANPLDFTHGMPPLLNPVNTDSLGEQIQREFPDLRVVKALNTMNAQIMVNPGLINGDHTVFMSGDDAAAKKQVRQILHAFGWHDRNILDLGDITTARGAEMLLPMWLRLWSTLGTSEFNFYIQKAE